jgi:hypothetical protein
MLARDDASVWTGRCNLTREHEVHSGLYADEDPGLLVDGTADMSALINDGLACEMRWLLPELE